MYHSVLKLFWFCLSSPNDVFCIKLETMAESISFFQTILDRKSVKQMFASPDSTVGKFEMLGGG